MAIEALHHNLYCSEVEIKVDGYSTCVEGNRCLYNAESRDSLRKDDYEKRIEK